MSRSRKHYPIYAGSTKYSRKKKYKRMANRLFRRRPIELSDVKFKKYTMRYTYDITDFHSWGSYDNWKDMMK